MSGEWRQLIYQVHAEEYTLDFNNLQARCPLDRARGGTACPPRRGLGLLSTLPTEVTHMILGYADVQTVVNLRSTHPLLRMQVDEMLEYRYVRAYAPNLLRGVLSVDLGSFLDFQTLYQALCTDKCASCGHFGAYVYLLTCTRVCFMCFTRQAMYLPVGCRLAKKACDLTYEEALKLPSMRPRPGHYTPGARKYKVARGKIGRQTRSKTKAMAIQNRLFDPVSLSKLIEATSELPTKHGRRLREIAAGRVKRLLPHEHLAVEDSHERNPNRFVGVIRMPSYDRQSKQREWGFYCARCCKLGIDMLKVRRRYTVCTFRQHIAEDHPAEAAAMTASDWESIATESQTEQQVSRLRGLWQNGASPSVEVFAS